ncbi:MAG TPA: hypothetical protein VMG36_05915 [Thermoplasmata archaeon]|nr:hypothetical protein [Thermoplasmata archaeon]
MTGENGDWLRARGIGRERFASYLADFLTSLGYAVEREEVGEPAESRVRGRLERMNPAVPAGASQVAFRFYPTSGGAACVWEGPTELPTDQRARMDRLVREMTSHLERAIATESHATAKVIRPASPHLPWAPDAGPTPS